MYFSTKNILKSYRNHSPKHVNLEVIIYKNDKIPVCNGRNSLDSWGFFYIEKYKLFEFQVTT
jgi:hypothetical protein